MNNISPEMAASFAAYAEIAGHFFHIAYKTGITLGMGDALATVFAKQLLEHGIAPKREQTKDVEFSALIARMTPGGSA